MASKPRNKAKRAMEALKEAAEYARRKRLGEDTKTIAEHFGIEGQTVRDRIRLDEAPKKIKDAALKLGVSLIQKLLRYYHRDPGHVMELIRGALKPNGQIDDAGYERCRVAAGDRGQDARLQYVRKRDADRS